MVSASVVLVAVVQMSGCDNPEAPTAALQAHEGEMGLVQAGDERLEARARRLLMEAVPSGISQ